jgi:YD repeat-containing protein
VSVSGDTVEWRYGNGLAVQETLTRDGRIVMIRSRSEDGRVETTEVVGGQTYEVQRDAAGLPSALVVDGVSVMSVSRDPDGSLAGIRTPDTEADLRRDRSGTPTGLLIGAPAADGRTTHWIEERWDALGRPILVTDSSGLEYRASFDDNGRLRGFRRAGRDGRPIGADITRDDDGRVTRVVSTWGSEQIEYSEAGTMTRIAAVRQGASTATTFDRHERPERHVAFDGGQTVWRYESDAPDAKPAAVDVPDGGRISYAWTDAGGAQAAEVTFGAASVRAQFDSEGRVVSLSWDRRAR